MGVETVATGNLVAQLIDAVKAEVDGLIESSAMQQWRDTNRLHPGDLVIFNNSFLYREGLAARSKNPRYLCARMSNDVVPVGSPSIARPNRLNSRFKRVPAQQVDDFGLTSLHVAVTEEIDRLGKIAQVLVARIGDDEMVEVKLSDSLGLQTLRFDPTLGRVANIEDEVVSVNRLDDIDVVWQAIETEMTGGNLSGLDQLAAGFEVAFGELRESAGRPVMIDEFALDGSCILGSVIDRVEEQVVRYSNALDAYHADPNDIDALNELLRIAYNFADGTKDLLSLVVGLSDLKPILFWLTAGAQSRLADSFANLPFGMVGTAKPSFERYRTVISSARNRAFHDVFAFGRPFHVRLPGDAFRSAELRMFQEYTKRTTKAGLDFEDKELVDLLAGFTRVSERAVPLGFWEKNLHVMEAVADVVRALRDALLLVAGQR
jgi:hypothetical protein